MTLEFDQILTLASEIGVSDVHLKAGLVPVGRKFGRIIPLAQTWQPLSATEINQYAEELLKTISDQNKFEHYKELDIGYGVKGVGRFRINLCRQRGSVRIIARVIKDQIPTIEELNLPPVVKKIARNPRGLVLVTGTTGAGKSTTLASMVNYINKRKSRHIITIEDPIEFLIRDRRSIVTQREIGLDTTTFPQALRAALRQDPDVILIGEMRDKETIETALLAAETGHLVLSTLHTYDARETINRILAPFVPHQQSQIRRQLAATLKGVISQRLAKRSDTQTLIPITEVFIPNARIREMILEPTKTQMITHAIETSAADTGMISFDQSLLQLVNEGKIDIKEAMTLTNNPDDFYLRYSGVQTGNRLNNRERVNSSPSTTDPSQMIYDIADHKK